MLLGTVVITASVKDYAGATGTVAATYEVFPTLTSVTPDEGRSGDTITIEALGLDRVVNNNQIVFFSAFTSAGVPTPFDSVNITARQGKVRVPQDAHGGPIRLSINGREAESQPMFKIIGPVPDCGSLGEVMFMADGGALVWYIYTHPTDIHDPVCPTIPVGRSMVARVRSDRTVEIVALDSPQSIPPDKRILGIALDKTLLEPAVFFKTLVSLNPHTWEHRLLYKGTETLLDVNQIMGVDTIAADFGPDGTLWVIDAANPTRLGRIDPLSGAFTHVLDVPTWTIALAVGCDNHAYIGIWTDGSGSNNISYALAKVDLQTGQIVAQTPANADYNRELTDLAVSCDTNELWGAMLTDVFDLHAVVGRATTTATSITPLAEVGSVIQGSYSEPAVTVGLSGQIHSYRYQLILMPPSSYWKGQMIPITGVNVNPCPTLAGEDPLAIPQCSLPGEMRILSTTTRWKPMRSAQSVVVKVESDNRLRLNPFVLKVTGYSSTGEVVVPQYSTPPFTAVEDSPVPPYRYTLTWPGPQLDGGGQPLRQANYKIVVEAVKDSDGSPVSSLMSDPNSIVSFVEVRRVSLRKCGSLPGYTCGTTGAPLGNNPSSGFGVAVYPDAEAEGLGYRRTLIATAEIEPFLGAQASQVPVHFAFVDVDDPSSAGIDPDANISPDNRSEDATIVTPRNVSPSLGGIAVTEFRASTQQGNNYRVIASTDSQWLGTICAVVPSTEGAVQTAPCTLGGPPVPLPSPDDTQVSHLVTVWLTLHLEIDHLDSGEVTQDGLDLIRAATKLLSTSLEDSGEPFIQPPPGDHPAANDWVGSTLWPLENQPFTSRVGGNDAVYLTPIVGGSFCSGTCPQPGTYRLSDDRWIDLANSPTLGILENQLGKAYIKVEPWASNPTMTHPFQKYIQTQAALGAFTKELTSSPEYWGVQLIGAFDGSIVQDCDPNGLTLPCVLGRTAFSGFPTGNCNQPIAAVFMEANRDWADQQTPPVAWPDVVVAHEVVCHALNIGDSSQHPPGSLCHAIGLPTNTNLRDEEIVQLRSLVQPRYRDNWNQSPPDECSTFQEN